MSLTSVTKSKTSIPSSFPPNLTSSCLSQKSMTLSKIGPRPIYQKVDTAIYNENTISHPPKAFSKSSSFLAFEFICEDTIPMSGYPPHITRVNKNIQIIRSIFSHEKIIYYFSFKLTCLGPSNLDFLSSLLKSSPPLTSLDLDLFELSATSRLHLHSLYLAFKPLKQLSRLSLSFSQTCHLNYGFLSALKTMSSLSNLSLKLSVPDSPNHSSFQTWPKYLTRLPHLSAFSLTLMECFPLCDKHLASLFSHFNKLTQTNSIRISFDDASNCTVQGLYHFFNSIKDLKKLSKISLETFKFDLFNQPEILAEGFALLDPSLLRELALDLSQTDFTDEGLIAFCAILRHFQSLKKFDLALARNQRLSYQNLEKLTLSLGKLPSLTSLELNVAYLEKSDNKYSSEIVGIISSDLLSLHQLRYLRIDFTKLTQTREGEFLELAFSLRYLTLLEKLSLVFNSCQNLTSNSIKHFASSLNRLVNLQVLSLDFSYIESMNNESLASLVDGIIRPGHLKDLELNFFYCRKIDCDGLKVLTEGFELLGELESVNLILPRTVGSLEELEKLFEVFGKLENLKIITFCVESVFLMKSLSDKFDIPGKEVNFRLL